MRSNRTNGTTCRQNGLLTPCGGCEDPCDFGPCGENAPSAITVRFSGITPCINQCLTGFGLYPWLYTDLPINGDFALAFDYCSDLGSGVRDYFYSLTLNEWGTLRYFAEVDTDCEGSYTETWAATLTITLRLRLGSLFGTGEITAAILTNTAVDVNGFGIRPFYTLFRDTDISFCQQLSNEYTGACFGTSGTTFAATGGTVLYIPDCTNPVTDCPGPCSACTAFAVEFTSDCPGEFPSASFTVENEDGACVWTDTASGYTIIINEDPAPYFATIEGNGYTFVFSRSADSGDCLTTGTWTFVSDSSSELPDGCGAPTLEVT